MAPVVLYSTETVFYRIAVSRNNYAIGSVARCNGTLGFFDGCHRALPHASVMSVHRSRHTLHRPKGAKRIPITLCDVKSVSISRAIAP